MGLWRRGKSRRRERLWRTRPGAGHDRSHLYFFVRTDIDERGDAVVTLAGELDHDSGAWLAARLGRLSATTKKATSARAVLDVGRVSFIDATGLRTLMSLVARLEAEGRRVALRSPSPALVRLLDLLDMRDRFAVAADLRPR